MVGQHKSERWVNMVRNLQVTHKVSERVAFFLSDIATERVAICQKIKTAYNHRSKFFHGDRLKNISSEIFFDIDDIVRKTMVKALTEKSDIFMGTREQLNQYFLDLVFGTAK